MIAADASLPHRTPLHRGARGSLVIVLTAFCPAGGNAAAEFKTSEMESRFERAYRDSRSLEVSFLETYKENGQLVRSEAGTGYFRRPGKMRFEYEAPEKNLFLVDGKTASQSKSLKP